MTKLIVSLMGLSLTLGCVKEPKQDLVYGPEIPKEEVASKLQTALGPQDSPSQIKLEEAVLSETTRFIRGRPILDILSSSETTVVERTETTTQWQIKDVEIYQEYNLSDPAQNPSPIVREDHKCWNKTSLVREECEIVPVAKRIASTLAVDDRLRPFSEFKQSSIEPEKTITYHNLKITATKESPPESVAKSANCQGIPDCQINVTKIEFDRVNWTENPEGYKIHYTIKVSPDVPQMSRFLESCQQGSVQIIQPGQDPKTAPRFLVTFCETVKNFLAGKSN